MNRHEKFLRDYVDRLRRGRRFTAIRLGIVADEIKRLQSLVTEFADHLDRCSYGCSEALQDRVEVAAAAKEKP